MEYKYRFLSAEEYPILDALFEVQGFGPVPDPKLSAIAVAQDDKGIIKGVLAMQLIPHVEPGWIAEESRGGVNMETMIHMVEKCAKDLGCNVVVTTESPIENVNRLCEINGMTKYAGGVYAKRIEV